MGKIPIFDLVPSVQCLYVKIKCVHCNPYSVFTSSLICSPHIHILFLREEEEERVMSAEDSEIMSITNSAIESLNKSDSFRSLVGDDFRQFLILPLGGYAFYLKPLKQQSIQYLGAQIGGAIEVMPPQPVGGGRMTPDLNLPLLFNMCNTCFFRMPPNIFYYLFAPKLDFLSPNAL